MRGGVFERLVFGIRMRIETLQHSTNTTHHTKLEPIKALTSLNFSWFLTATKSNDFEELRKTKDEHRFVYWLFQCSQL
ncbi:CLUMA_CG018854, isoform A [Clunio marinus]|uniref:CLUMA_CG018854, isoform A n=1 Tax=Clunio marinus TaxID=568069 RepID=A0A1J1IZY6_9DIPT|nr:CLUMA_CG018854, isoform A [Clunio marinus]